LPWSDYLVYDFSKEKSLPFMRHALQYLQTRVMTLEKKLEEAERVETESIQTAVLLKEELVQLRDTFFGSGQEKHVSDKSRNKMPELKNKKILHNKNISDELIADEDESKSNFIQSPDLTLDSEEVIHTLESDKLECESCRVGRLVEKPNFFDVSSEIDTIDKLFKAIIHKRQIYECDSSGLSH
jgi:hypothetical protein